MTVAPPSSWDEGAQISIPDLGLNVRLSNVRYRIAGREGMLAYDVVVSKVVVSGVVG